MPWHDWQFWLVTAAALVAAWFVLRTVLPRRKDAGPGCPGCGPGQAAARPRRTTLTVSARDRAAPRG
jgi:hypothetical protein